MTPLPTTLDDSLLLQLADAISPSTDLEDPRTHQYGIVEWIEKFFWVPELRGPIQLVEYQKRCLREATSLDENGDFKYSTIVWSDIKKSIKSTIAAAVALYRAFHVEWGQVVLVANDLDQADSRVGYYIRRACEMNPALKSMVKTRGYQTWLPNRTRIESVPIDPSGEAGGNADMVVFSELWGAHQEAQKRMWTEMTLSPTKYGKSFRWIETYAGFSGESLLLEQLYDQGVNHGIQIWEDLPAYRNEPARMFCLWNQSPRCPWQTKEYYAQEEATLTPNEFLRVHRNSWVSSEESFVPIEWWDALREKLPPLDPREPMVLALDAGTASDNFALVGVTRHPDPTRRDHDIAVRIVMKWDPKAGKIDFLGTEENPGPEMMCHRLCKMYNIVQICYDPYQLYDMSMRLGQAGLTWVSSFDQGRERLEADKQLYDLISQRRLAHDGDLNLREHVGNANRQSDDETGKIRIIKKSALSKIDLCIATSMASHRCLQLNI
ncbi:MAG: terminase large subunit [Methanothrix sp.]|nr:terminase large subunit [Methanothrix sp.]